VYLFVIPAFAASQEPRQLQFTYELLPQDFPSDEAVDIYIPLPARNDGQRVRVESLQSFVPAILGEDNVHGNTFLHLRRPANSNTPLTATLSWTIDRDIAEASGASELAAAEREQYLAPNALVPVDHEILQPILAEIHQLRVDDSPAATARAIYDWVVDNVEYKKVGTGWGNGDTFWACNERYGNCTDFHALFISLARSEGIPARFEIGFPIPLDRKAGEIGGYHCWVQFYLPERGWVPIDASEAAKTPELRDKLYGGQPADRILFTTGRDLIVSEFSGKAPLNYFIYPYVEVGGKPWKGSMPTRFSFVELSSS
jgi:transglutaminase-like putative cysteine protease